MSAPNFRLRLSDRAQSVLEIFVLDSAIPDEEFPRLRACADLAHGVLVVPRAQVDEVLRELTELANAEDDRANPRDEPDPERRAHARYGRDAITAVGSRLLREAYPRPPAFGGDGSPGRA